MKKYSSYFKALMVFALISLIVTIAGIKSNIPISACAITLVCAFIFWFTGIMAPDDEKYNNK